MNTIGWLESIWQDLRYGARAAAVESRICGRGHRFAGAGDRREYGDFSITRCRAPAQLAGAQSAGIAEVKIVGGNHGMGLNQQYGELTRPIWQEIRDHQQAFSGVFAWSVNQRYVGQGSQMRRFNGLWVSGDFFRVLGVRPWRGRLLMPEDEGACPVRGRWSVTPIGKARWAAATSRPASS